MHFYNSINIIHYNGISLSKRHKLETIIYFQTISFTNEFVVILLIYLHLHIRIVAHRDTVSNSNYHL